MFDQLLGQINLASFVLFALLAIFLLVVGFFVNRASVRANLQVKLLAEIAEQQRRQTELLELLVRKQGKTAPDDAYDDDHVSSLRGFIPER